MHGGTVSVYEYPSRQPCILNRYWLGRYRLTGPSITPAGPDSGYGRIRPRQAGKRKSFLLE